MALPIDGGFGYQNRLPNHAAGQKLAWYCPQTSEHPIDGSGGAQGKC